MKGITTIAALPSGAGQAAALPAEVGEKPAAGVADDFLTAANAILARVTAGEISGAEANRLIDEWSSDRAARIVAKMVADEVAATMREFIDGVQK